MHEFAIARNILKTLTSVAAEHGRPVVSAAVTVGPMTGIVPELLAEAYQGLARGTPLEGSVLHVEQVPVKAVCSKCGADVESYEPFIHCAECESLDLSIQSGYELEVVSAELRDSDDTGPGG